MKKYKNQMLATGGAQICQTVLRAHRHQVVQEACWRVCVAQVEGIWDHPEESWFWEGSFTQACHDAKWFLEQPQRGINIRNYQVSGKQGFNRSPFDRKDTNSKCSGF